MEGTQRLGSLLVRGSNPHEQQSEGSGGPNQVTGDVLGEERSPGGEVCVFPVLPTARHLGLFTPVTLLCLAIVLALLAVSPPAHADKGPGGLEHTDIAGIMGALC